MSAEVDQRVVSMQFDNAQFEKGVQQTLLSLNNLDNSINKAASQNGRSFTGLINSLNGVDQKITTGILPTMDLVNSKFSFMGVMADQWLRNMATSVQGFVSRTLHGLFQIRGGMAEYELKMGSIQTIMNGTGESLGEVTKQLDELNHYSDKTIYAFKDMTDNIGKFTNQGVKLNDAVNAIKGIANEAALSGANAMQASHAMYNFSQALSAGYVKLIDWKSIENSMMATVGFKNALLETAAALGTVTKKGEQYITTTTNAQGKVSDLFNAQKGFNDSLQNQWLSSKVLTQTLEFYATDIRDLTNAEKAAYEAKLRNIGLDEEQIKYFEQLGINAANAATEIKTFSMLVDTITEAIGSGWAKSFEIVLGDFNEAKALWTELGHVIGNFVDSLSDARNAILQSWKDLGGRSRLIDGLVGVFNGLLSVLYPLREAFLDVFGVMDGTRLASMTEVFANFAENLRLSNEEMDKLAGVARIVFTILKNLIDIVWRFKAEIAGIFLIVKAFTLLKAVIAGGLGLSAIFGILKMIIALAIGAKLLGLTKYLSNIHTLLKKISASPIGKLILTISNGIGFLVKQFITLFNYVKESKAFNNLLNVLVIVIDKFKELYGYGKEFISKISFDDITNSLSKFLPVLKTMGTSIASFFTSTKAVSDNVVSSVKAIEQPVANTAGAFDTITAKVDNLLSCFNMTAYAAESAEKPVYTVGAGLVTVAEGIETLQEETTEAVEPMRKWTDIIGEWLTKIENVAPALSPAVESVREFINGLNSLSPTTQAVLDFFAELASKVNWAKVIAFGALVVYIQMLKKINGSVAGVGKTIDRFGQHFDNLFGGVHESIKTFIQDMSNTAISIQGFFNAMTSQYKKTNFKNTAFGILALAGAFGILAVSINYLDPEVLIGAGVALALLAGAVVAVNYAFVKMSTIANPAGMAAIAGAFLLLNATILTLTLTMLGLGLTVLALRKAVGTVDGALKAMAVVWASMVLLIASGISILISLAGVMASIGSAAPAILMGAGAVSVMSASIMIFNAALLSTALALTALTPFIAAFVVGVKFMFSAITDALGMFIHNLKYIDDTRDVFMILLNLFGPLAVAVIGVKLAIKTLTVIASDLMTAGVMMGVGATAFGAGLMIMVTGLVALSPIITAVIFGFKMLIKHITDGLGEFIQKIKLIHTIPGAFMSLIHAVAPIVTAIGLLIISFVGVMVSLGAINILMKQISGSMLKVAASIALLGVAIQLWANINPDQLLNAGVAIVGMMAGIALALKMLDAVNIGKIGGALLGLVVALYMLTPLAALYGLAWDVIAKGLIAISIGLLAIGGAAKLMEKANTGKILGAALAISGLVGALTYLSVMLGAEFKDNAEGMTQALVSMLAMITTFAIATDIIANMSANIKSVAKMAGVMVLFSAVVAGMVVALSALAAFDAQSLLITAEALGVAIASFAGSMVFIAIASAMLENANILGMAGLMLTMAASMILVGDALSYVSGIDTETLVAFFAGFTIVVVALSVAMAGLGDALGKAVSALPILGAIGLLALAIGLYVKMAGEGFKSMAEALDIVLGAIGRFFPVFVNFLSSLADLSNRAEDIAKTSESIGVFAKVLIELGTSMGIIGVSAIAFGAGLIVAAGGLGALSIALGVAGIAVAVFAAGVSSAINTISEPVNKAVEWGTHLVQNFASGIIDGIPVIVSAVDAIGKTVKGYIGHTNPIWGVLAGGVEKIWGIHLDENFASGIIEGITSIFTAGDAAGLAAKLGIANGTDGAGDNAMSNIISEISGWCGSFFDQGAAAGSNWMAGFKAAMGAEGGIASAGYTEGKEYDSSEAAYAEQMYGKGVWKNYKRKFADSLDFKSMIEEAKKGFDDVTKNMGETPPGGGGAGGGSGSGSGASAKDNKEELKKQAEAAKLHEKYLKLSTKAALAYDGAYEKLNSTLDDTKPSTNAQNAISALAEHLYKASLTGDETADELAEKAKKTEEVFITMYENIKSKTKDSLDFFKEFNRGFDDVIKPKQLMKNINSQIRGNIEMTEMWNIAAIRGFDSKLLKSLEEEGAEGMSKFRSLLQLSEDELSKYMKALEKTDSVADFVASTGMSSLAINLEILKLKERNEKRKEYVTEGKKIIEDWNSIENDGSLASQAAYDITAKRMQQLAEKYKVSVEEIQKAASDEADGIKSASEKELEYFDKVSTAYYKWVNTYKTKSEEMKQAIGDFMTSFSEFKTEEEGEDALTTEKIIDNLETRQKAMEEWYENLTELQEKGLNQKKFDELLAAGPEGSYQEVKLLAEASEEEFDKINDLLDEAAQLAKAKSEQFGIESAQAVIGGFDTTLVPYFTQMIENFGSNFNFSQLAEVAGVTFNAIGEQITGGVKDGIETGTPDVKASTEYMAEGVDQKAEQYINKENGFSKAENFMLGILNGIEEYKDEVLSAIDDVCSAVGDCVQEDWEIHSPSHLTHRFAGFFIKGMINGFRHYGSDAVLAVKENAVDPIVNNLKKAMSTAYNILTSEDDFNPTITPVLDLSNIEAGSRSLSSLMTNNGFRVQANLGTVNTPASKLDSLSSMLKNGVMNSQNAGNNYNFVQNNYSPKALSRLDIYRQTKNQFAQLKGLVN